MAKGNTYDADSISVLEGLEAVLKTAWHVHWKRFHKRIESSDL